MGFRVRERLIATMVPKPKEVRYAHAQSHEGIARAGITWGDMREIWGDMGEIWEDMGKIWARAGITWLGLGLGLGFGLGLGLGFGFRARFGLGFGCAAITPSRWPVPVQPCRMPVISVDGTWWVC